MQNEDFIEYSRLVQDLSSIGLIILDKRLNVLLWNRFMELHSRIKHTEILGRKLTQFFPDINETWLNKKVTTSFILNSQSSTSWEQRPYLFNLPSTQISIEGCDFMYQNCNFFPIRNGSDKTVAVGIIIHDVTEIAVTQMLLENITEKAVELDEVNTRDFLTGLYNRKFFFEQLAQDLSRCRRLNTGLSIAIIDADFFKKINDTYGHQAGDYVLQELAQRLLKTLRTSDSLCRYGGEEFALILPSLAGDQALQVCDRLRCCVNESPMVYNGQEIKVTVSIGVSTFKNSQAIENTLEQADSALYKAKNNGRDRVEFYLKD